MYNRIMNKTNRFDRMTRNIYEVAESAEIDLDSIPKEKFDRAVQMSMLDKVERIAASLERLAVILD